QRALQRMESVSGPFAFIVPDGTVHPEALHDQDGAERNFQVAGVPEGRFEGEPLHPDVVLRLIQERARETDVVLATTGYTGRALYAVGDRSNQFYVVGSMGCVSSIGLGLA